MENLEVKIQEKQQELRSLQALNNQIVKMTQNFEQLQENMYNLSEGTEAISEIMVHWQKMLKSISMASLSLQRYSAGDYENFESKKSDEMPLPETLVRIRTDREE